MSSPIQTLEQETGELDGRWADSLERLEGLMRQLPVAEHGPQTLRVGQKGLIERTEDQGQHHSRCAHRFRRGVDLVVTSERGTEVLAEPSSGLSTFSVV